MTKKCNRCIKKIENSQVALTWWQFPGKIFEISDGVVSGGFFFYVENMRGGQACLFLAIFSKNVANPETQQAE